MKKQKQNLKKYFILNTFKKIKQKSEKKNLTAQKVKHI